MNLSFTEVVTVIFSAIGGSAVALAFARNLFNKVLTEAFERNRLTLKNDLDLTLYKHQTQFAKLHEHRAEVIAEVYSLLVDFERSATYFFCPLEREDDLTLQQKYEQTFKVWYSFRIYFAKKRLYLPEQTCQQIDDSSKNLFNHVSAFGSSLRYSNMNPQQVGYDIMMQKQDKAWGDALEYVEKELPITKRYLENEFRALLGMEIS